MRLIMVAAVSKDGFITKGDDPDPSSWTSAEDKTQFKELREKHDLFVMGSRTYEASGVKPSAGTLRIVLSENPEKYSSFVVPGQLEFYSLTPREFVKMYEGKHQTCLVLGGSYVFLEFLEADLINEIYLTVEPVIHNSGVPLLANGKALDDFDLPTPHTTVLNEKGTQLLHYRI